MFNFFKSSCEKYGHSQEWGEARIEGLPWKCRKCGIYGFDYFPAYDPEKKGYYDKYIEQNKKKL